MKAKLFQKCIFYTLIPLAILIRIYHHYNWAIWGSDTGEYIYLTRAILENGQMLTEGYLGWGRAYPDFQGMQLLAASISLLTKLDYHTVLLWAIPTLSSLSGILLFFIAKKITSFTPALFASAFYSATFAVVFANSHAMPGGLAEPLGFLLLIGWINYLQTIKYSHIWILFSSLSFLGLLITHHFTLLLIMAAVVGILVVEISAGNKYAAKPGIIAIGILSTLISIYWLIYAKSFRQMLDKSAFSSLSDDLPVTLILMSIPPVFLLFLWNVKNYLKLPRIKYNLSHNALTKRITIAFLISLISILVILWKGVPGTIAPLQAGEYQAFPYLAINALWISLAVAPNLVTTEKNGWLLWGWFIPILTLASIGGISGSHVLIAYRHAPYLIAPLALMAGIGFKFLLNGYQKEQRKWISISTIIVFLICSSMAYPPPAVMGGFQEGTNDKEIASILWFQFAEKNSLVVSDHRLSSLAFGLTKVNASWENGADIITGNLNHARNESIGLSTPQAGKKDVNYILLSSEMKKGVALLQWDPTEELTGEAEKKFTDNDALPIWFDNGDSSIMRMNPH